MWLVTRWLVTRRPGAFAVAVALTVVAGCGVSSEDSPRNVTPPPGPYQALNTPTAATPGAGTVAEPVCFLRDGELVEVVRRVSRLLTVDTQVRHLLAGPNEAERTMGLTTALPGAVVIASVRLAGGEVVIDVAGDFDDVGRNDQVLAYGQIVCSLTARSDVSAVSFMHGGEPWGVPRADGSLSRGPLTAADYADLMASP